MYNKEYVVFGSFVVFSVLYLLILSSALSAMSQIEIYPTQVNIVSFDSSHKTNLTISALKYKESDEISTESQIEQIATTTTSTSTTTSSTITTTTTTSITTTTIQNIDFVREIDNPNTVGNESNIVSAGVVSKCTGDYWERTVSDNIYNICVDNKLLEVECKYGLIFDSEHYNCR